MDEKLDIIIKKISDIELQLSKLQEDVEIIKSQTCKMDKHVDFVNNVYEQVEQPLNYVVDRWNNLFGSISWNETKMIKE
jgi:archaellum component FlaC